MAANKAQYIRQDKFATILKSYQFDNLCKELFLIGLSTFGWTPCSFYNSMWLVANDIIIGVAVGSFLINNSDYLASKLHEYLNVCYPFHIRNASS